MRLLLENSSLSNERNRYGSGLDATITSEAMKDRGLTAGKVPRRGDAADSKASQTDDLSRDQKQFLAR